MLIDTHAHLDFSEFESDLDGVLERAQDAGVSRIITIGTGVESSRRAVALAERHPALRAVIGVHPNNAAATAATDPKAIDHLRELVRHPKIAAIGETGLDYFRLPQGEPAEIAAIKQAQADLFTQQLELAAESGLNVVIHQRGDCFEDTMALLAPWQGRLRAVFHCFTGTQAQADALLAAGHLLSFTGIVTFRNAQEVQQIAASVPPERFMVETDCPFLAPIPHRGKRCEPAYTRQTAEKIAELRGITLETLARQTSETAAHFFRL